MRYLARTAAIAAAAMLAGGPVAGAAEPPTGYTASYKVYTAGLHALDFELAATVAAERFVARMSASPHGIIAKFIPWALEASSAGVLAAGELRPRRHRSANWWRGEQRWVEIDFDGEGPVDLRAEPASEGDGMGAIAAAMLVGAIDPVSAINGIILSNADGVLCPPRTPVFDGRRRYDMVMERLPARTLKGRGDRYGGVVEGCRLTLEPVAGKRDDDEARTFPVVNAGDHRLVRRPAGRRADGAGAPGAADEVRPDACASAPPRPARVWPTACGGSAPPGAWPAPRSTP